MTAEDKAEKFGLQLRTVAHDHTQAVDIAWAYARANATSTKESFTVSLGRRRLQLKRAVMRGYVATEAEET